MLIFSEDQEYVCAWDEWEVTPEGFLNLHTGELLPIEEINE
jgi:hypothetical protein